MSRVAAIAALNDALRQSFVGGKVVMTAGVCALPEAIVPRALERLRAFDAFDGDSDPHGEHDFGAFAVGSHRFFFKIDYYDRAMTFGLPDPSDPAVTSRVLTLMLASEY